MAKSQTGLLRLPNGKLLSTTAGAQLRNSKLRSSHTLPGASRWWCPAGDNGQGEFAVLQPDNGAIVQPNDPGGRGSVFMEAGTDNVRVTVNWYGIIQDDAGPFCGPMFCVDPDVDAFALCFGYEAFFNAWWLWEVGRKPDNISAGPLASWSEVRTPGDPATISMELSGTDLLCKVDGTTRVTYDMGGHPLQGATKHGITLDVNNYDPRSDAAGVGLADAPFNLELLG